MPWAIVWLILVTGIFGNRVLEQRMERGERVLNDAPGLPSEVEDIIVGEVAVGESATAKSQERAWRSYVANVIDENDGHADGLQVGQKSWAGAIIDGDEDTAEAASQAALKDLDKNAGKNSLEERSSEDADEVEKGVLQFPVLKETYGLFVDLTHRGNLTNGRPKDSPRHYAFNKSKKNMFREKKFKKCPMKRKKCKCGFKHLFWAYTKTTKTSRDLTKSEDFCYSLRGVCSKCKNMEKIVSVGFDYMFEEEKQKAIVEFEYRTQKEEWFPNKEPMYEFTCKQGLVLKSVLTKYVAKKQKGQQKLALARDKYKLIIHCGIPKFDGEIMTKMQWFNCNTQNNWSKEKRQWCRRVRAKKKRDGDPVPPRKQPTCVNQMPQDGQKMCRDRVMAIMSMGVNKCTEILEFQCPVSCQTCCGDEDEVFAADNTSLNMTCPEKWAELTEMGVVECPDLLKGQCAATCGLCTTTTTPEPTTTTTLPPPPTKAITTLHTTAKAAEETTEATPETTAEATEEPQTTAETTEEQTTTETEEEENTDESTTEEATDESTTEEATDESTAETTEQDEETTTPEPLKSTLAEVDWKKYMETRSPTTTEPEKKKKKKHRKMSYKDYKAERKKEKEERKKKEEQEKEHSVSATVEASFSDTRWIIPFFGGNLALAFLCWRRCAAKSELSEALLDNEFEL